MATIRKEIAIAAPSHSVWPAIRDVGAVHRLAPGFVLDTRLDGDCRIVSFANGLVVRERLFAVDDALCRVAYSVIDGGRARYHHASLEVRPDGAGSSRVVWTTDLLPDEVGPLVGALMEEGLGVMKATLEQQQG
jgi:hypothetical protein